MTKSLINYEATTGPEGMTLMKCDNRRNILTSWSLDYDMLYKLKPHEWFFLGTANGMRYYAVSIYEAEKLLASHPFQQIDDSE